MTGTRISSDAHQAAGHLAAVPGTVNAAVGMLTARYGSLLVTRIRARASGRPGPRRQTGDYRRSWSQQTAQIAPSVWRAVAGTNSPQGWRLEKGFVGVDAIGRTYNQPPYPHAGPAADQTAPEYYAAIDKVIEAITTGRTIGLVGLRVQGVAR